MLKIKHWQLNWLGLGSALALMSATIAPAAAEQVIVIDGGGISIGVNQPRVRGNSIYYNQPRVRGNSIYYNQPRVRGNSIYYNQPRVRSNSIYYNQPRVRGNSIYYGNPIRVNQPPTVGNFIYGSPIPTPIPVNPTTGLIPSRSSGYYYSPYRQNLRNSTFVNPVLVNPTIRDSRLINPAIVRDSWHRTPVRQRVIYNYPW